MKILFLGHVWLGSSARGMKEALAALPDVCMEDVGVDLYVPAFRARRLAAANRLLFRWELAELEKQVWTCCQDFQPDVIVAYKGWHFRPEFVRAMKEKIAPVVNIFPDASPHAHGERLKAAVGVYDLVISSKKYHPPIWKSVYGYDNPCIFVPHGYIPSLHLRHAMSENYSHDVVLVATARSEYFNLMRDLTGSLGPGVRLAICGSGWERQNMGGLGIDVCPEKHGQAYVEWLRRAKITLSPIQTSVNVGSTVHQGDEVTTRTFQCAAAYTFFIHRRTAEVKTYYDEATEVPMYDNPAELADQIRYYLAHDEKRKAMAAAAHARAVPAYSLDAKAAEIRPWLERVIKRQLLSRPAASASGESLR